MRLTVGAALVWALSAAVSGTSAQQLKEGPYIGVYGGASLFDDANNRGASGVAGAGDIAIKSSFDTGFVVGGTAGFRMNSGNLSGRLELDLSYRQADISNFTVTND